MTMPNIKVCFKCGKHGIYDNIHDRYCFNKYPDIILCHKCSRKWKQMVNSRKHEFDAEWLKGGSIGQFSQPFIVRYWRAWEKEIDIQFDAFIGVIVPEKVVFT